LPNGARLPAGEPRVKGKIMIYTTHELINHREGERGQILGPQAKMPSAAIYEYASNRA
jgi:hypothetical protein